MKEHPWLKPYYDIMTRPLSEERRNYFVYDAWKSKEEVQRWIAQRGKPKIWRDGLGDIKEDGVYKVWGADNSWSCEVELRNGYVIKVT